MAFHHTTYWKPHGSDELPNPMNAIGIEGRILTDDWDLLNQRLGDEQAIKWIAVVSGQGGQRQERGAEMAERSVGPLLVGQREREFLESHFDRDFPNRRGA